MIRLRPTSNPPHPRREAEALAARFGILLSEARRISANIIHGAHGRRKKGSGETFWEFRAARDEDPASSIDWRRSAKSDALYVRETEWEAANTIFLWRDANPGMRWQSDPSLPTKADRAAVLLAALGICLLKGGERCFVPGVSTRPGTGIGATTRICQDIITGSSAADTILANDRRTQAHLVLASDFLEGMDVWHERLLHIQQSGLSVILLHIFDPAEEIFPFGGHTVFQDPSGKRRIDFGRAQTAKAQYQKQFLAGRDQISELARRFGFLFVSHRTDHNPADACLALYQGLQNGPMA